MSYVTTVPVHGLAYLDASPQELRDILRDRLSSPPVKGTVIFTPNAEIGAACQSRAELRNLVDKADLLLPDGAGVVAASRRACPARPLRHRLPGIDAGETVLRLCAEMGLSAYFLGGRPGVASAAATRWRERLPALRIAGTRDGYFEKSGEENNAVVREIARARPDVLFVCFGFPKQERWITENRNALPSVRLWMGLGGSFDVWAGAVKRAPSLLQALRLEWLWRSLRRPERLGHFPGMVRYVLSAKRR